MTLTNEQKNAILGFPLYSHGRVKQGAVVMTPAELALLTLGAAMTFGVFAWIAACLIRARNG